MIGTAATAAISVEQLELNDWQSQRSLLEPILKLMQLVQPHYPRTLDMLRWLYFDGPYGPGRIYVLRYQGEIASIHCNAPVMLKHGNRVLRARRMQDVMTHPAMRRRGFMRRLAEISLSDHEREKEVGYSFPNKLSEGGLRQSEWQPLCAVPLQSKAVGPAGRELEIRVQPIERVFPGSVDEIFEAAEIETGVCRRSEYLNWRYGNPLQTYHRFVLGDGEGVLVLKPYEKNGQRYAHICDLMLKRSSAGMLPAALRFAESFAYGRNARTLTAFVSNGNRSAKVFEEAGFRPCDNEGRVVLIGGAGAYPGIDDASSWHLSHGDNDAY